LRAYLAVHVNKIKQDSLALPGLQMIIIGWCEDVEYKKPKTQKCELTAPLDA